MAARKVVVIGASAGGVDALSELIGALSAELPAAVCAVLHLPRASPPVLASLVDSVSRLPVVTATDRVPIESGRVYIAPPDNHLLVEREQLRVVRGPEQNRHRPAIDPLFRSAAWAYGPDVIGIVLTGALDDGAAGLWAIKTCGGITVVQDPADALYPEMPTAAMSSVEVDHCLPLKRIPPLITELVQEVRGRPSIPAPPRLRVEVEQVTMERNDMNMDAVGTPSAFTCPACGGALWQMEEDRLLHYRCHTGHAFSPDSLVGAQSEAAEQALFVALRALKEQHAAAERIAESYRGKYPGLETRFRARAQEHATAAEVIQNLLARRPSD